MWSVESSGKHPGLFESSGFWTYQYESDIENVVFGNVVRNLIKFNIEDLSAAKIEIKNVALRFINW